MRSVERRYPRYGSELPMVPVIVQAAVGQPDQARSDVTSHCGGKS
jgi:hypothetical protein